MRDAIPWDGWLLGWGAMLPLGLCAAWAWALVLAAAAFIGLAVEDTRAARRSEVPRYFARLRPWQMGFGAVATLLCRAAP